MKNVVVEINDQYAVVLTDTGDFKRVFNNSGLKVGDVILEKVKSIIPRLTKAAASLAAVFLIGFMASFYYLSYTPHGYIDVRINPGIKITLNAMDKVIRIDGLNDDGKLLLENITEKESDPKKTLELIVSKAIEMGFFKEGNPIRITVAMKNPEKVAGMETTLMETAQTTLKNNSVDVPVSAFSIDVQDYKKLDTDRADEAADTTDYSPAWKEKTVTPSICDVKFDSGNIIIEFNHNLTLDNAKVYAYADKNPDQKLEAKIIDFKNDKLTVSFESLAPGESYKLEVTGITTKDDVLLDPITAKIIQPANKVKNAEDETIPGDSSSTDLQNNGNGSVNGSNNGNYRNEDGNGNGNANGLDKNQEQEKLKEQEKSQEQDEGNVNGNVDQNLNENINQNPNQEQNDEASNGSVTPPIAMIKSIDLIEGRYEITFNMDLSLAGAKVTAAPANDPTKIITGQATVSDDHTLLVSFTSLEPNTPYIVQVENAALKDGTGIDPLKINVHTNKDEKTNKGNKND